MSDEGLQEAYARAVATRTPAERGACPAPEAILALVRRDGGEDERLGVLDHVMACFACRGEFELLRTIDLAGREAVKGERPVGARSERAGDAPGRVVGHISWRRWTPLAAAAVILVLALGPGRRLWQPGAEPVRGGGESVVLVAPGDGITLTAATITFVWRSTPGAARYGVELLTSGGVVALGRTTPDTSVTVALPRTVRPGDYHWWVVATAGDGTETRSDTRMLRLRAR